MQKLHLNIIATFFYIFIFNSEVNAENYFNPQSGSTAPLTMSSDIFINSKPLNNDWEKNNDWENRILQIQNLGFNPSFMEIKAPTKKDSKILQENYDSSILSYDIYDKKKSDENLNKKILGTDYKLIKYQNDDLSGFNAGIYEDSQGHLIVAFGGTTAQERDGKKQIEQDAFADLSLLYKKGNENAQFTKLRDFLNVDELNNKEYLITGHSLGGGLAQYASFYTGKPAVTYNTAPMTINEIALSNLPKNSNKTPNILNIRTPDDPLTLIQKIQENLEQHRTPNPEYYSQDAINNKNLELENLVDQLFKSKDLEGKSAKLALIGLITKKQIEILKDFKNWGVKRNAKVESVSSLLDFIQVNLYKIPTDIQIGKLIHGEIIDLDMASGHSMLDIAITAYSAKNIFGVGSANVNSNLNNSSKEKNGASASANANANANANKLNERSALGDKSNIGSFNSTVNIKGTVTQTATGNGVKQDLNVGSAQKSQANSFNAVVTTGNITQSGKDGAQQFINVGGMNNSKVDRFDAQVTTGNIEQIGSRGERQEMDIGSVTNSTVSGTATTRVSTGAIKQTGDGEIALGAIKNSNVKQFQSNLNVQGKLEGNNIRMGSVIGQEKYDNDGNYAGQAK